MQISNQNWLAPRDVRYTINGENLHHMRRARLRVLAKKLNLPADGTHQTLLRGIIAQLDMTGAPDELTELRAMQDGPKEVPTLGVEEQIDRDVNQGAHIMSTDDLSGHDPLEGDAA